jgi:general secretion pathway protein A
MYEDYYGFSENPFGLTTDPKYHFRSASHASAFELVQYALGRREGFVAITGQIGTGKTTLCRAILERADRTVVAALVLDPLVSDEQLLRVILQQFGLVSRDQVRRGQLASATKAAMIDTIRAFLLSLQPLGAHALLVIDDAQDLPPARLAQIRALSSVEGQNETLLQVVLASRTNLRDALSGSGRTRPHRFISTRCELKPLSRDETSAYISHRLAVAGGAGVSFSRGAVAAVHGCTLGVPRLVNALCGRSLFHAYEDRTNRVLSCHVDGAAESLDLARPGRLLLAWAR